MPRRPPPSKKGIFKIFRFEISLNTVATTVFGSITWLLISYGIGWVKDSNTALHRTLPALQTDVATVKKDIKQVKVEQERISKEYVPPLKK